LPARCQNSGGSPPLAGSKSSWWRDEAGVQFGRGKGRMARMRRRKAMLVLSPPMAVSTSIASTQARCSRFSPQAISLASIGS
jgi:hypothetical protein